MPEGRPAESWIGWAAGAAADPTAFDWGASDGPLVQRELSPPGLRPVAMVRNRCPMRERIGLSLLLLASTWAQPENPAIDAASFRADVAAALDRRDARRLGEAEFLAPAREPGVVILDARSADRYRELHVVGAVNLPLPDFTEAALAERIPSRDSIVLIYCNNNFRDAPTAFPSKLPAAALNLSTFVALHTYGYRNVHELGPLISVHDTLLPLEGTSRTDGPGPGARP